MNDSTNMNWLTILLPAVVSGLFVIAAQILFAFWLSRRIQQYRTQLDLDVASYQHSLNSNLEDYKTALNRDLQTHIAQLQTANQVAQTKFSAFHTRRAEAIETLYEYAARVERELEEWLVFDSLSKAHSKADHFKMLKDHEEELTKFFDDKRIYWDRALVTSFFNFLNVASLQIPSRALVKLQTPNLASSDKTNFKQNLNAHGRNLGDNCIRLLNE